MKTSNWKDDGTRNGHSAFRRQDIWAIREKWDAGLTPEGKAALADLYGCSLDTIRKIGLRKTFKDVPDVPQLEGDTVQERLYDSGLAQRMLELTQQVRGPQALREPTELEQRAIALGAEVDLKVANEPSPEPCLDWLREAEWKAL